MERLKDIDTPGIKPPSTFLVIIVAFSFVLAVDRFGLHCTEMEYKKSPKELNESE